MGGKVTITIGEDGDDVIDYSFFFVEGSVNLLLVFIAIYLLEFFSELNQLRDILIPIILLQYA